MPQLQHRKPCSQCPYRRRSAPGWLGAATPQQFLASTLGEEHMPCHAAVDYDDPAWRESQYPQAPMCAGSLVFMANTSKLPRDPSLAAAVRQVDADHDTVFSRPDEFLDHHADPHLPKAA